MKTFDSLFAELADKAATRPSGSGTVALLDAGVHAGGLEEAEALELMTRRGYQEEGEAVGKWRRALLTSAQLSTYFVGYAELAPLLAGRTTFDEVLAHGSPAPRHLRTLLSAPS